MDNPSDEDKLHNYEEKKQQGRRRSLSPRSVKNSGSVESEGRGRGGKQAVQDLSNELADTIKSQNIKSPKLQCITGSDGGTDTDKALDSGEGAEIGQGQKTTSEGRKTRDGGRRGVTNRGRTAGKRNETWCKEAIPGMSMRVGSHERPGLCMAKKARTYGELDWTECSRNGMVSDNKYHTVSGDLKSAWRVLM